MLIIISLALIGSTLVSTPYTGDTVTTTPVSTITSQRGPGDVTDLLPLNRNFTYYSPSSGRNIPQNWSYTAGSPSKSSSINYYWTNSYGYGQPLGCAYAYIYTSSTGTVTWTFDWWQDFLYNGTIKMESPSSAYLSFRYYILYIRYPSSSNYLRVYLRYPDSTDHEVWSTSITATTSSWTLVSLNVTSLITQAGNGTYRMILRYDGNLNVPSGQGGYTYFLWDDAGLTIQHPPRVLPYDLRLAINGGAAYANRTSVLLSPAGSGLSDVAFCNNKTGPYIWNTYQTGAYDWNLNATGGDGPKTVWYWAKNSVGTSGPVNSSIFLDTHPPTRSNPASPNNGAAVNTNIPTFTWSAAVDTGSKPSGLTNYTLLLDVSPSFSTGNLRVRSTNNTFWNAIQSLTEGSWYWCVIAGDKAGNVNASGYYMVIVDTVAPAPIATGLSPGDGAFSNDITLTFGWSPPYDSPPSSGFASYDLQYSQDPAFTNCTNVIGITATSYSIPLSSPLGNGTWYWRVRGDDVAGNLGQYSTTRAVNIITADNAPHAPNVISPRGDYTESLSPILRWTPAQGTALSLLDYYEIEIDDSSQFNNSTGAKITFRTAGGLTTDTGQIPVQIELSLGLWHWRIRAVDKAGNPGAWSQVNSFTIYSGTNPMLIAIAGGGSGGAVFILILGYYLVRRSRIPFVIKKIDQSIKLISKGEVPQPVPMRTRTQLVKSIFETKLVIMSKERLEEAEGKKKVSKEAVISPEKLAPQGLPKGAEAPAKAEAEESDVDLVAKELEKLEAKEEKKPSDETDLIKREIEELEKGSKKKRKSESG